jgi:hypothetical protein
MNLIRRPLRRQIRHPIRRRPIRRRRRPIRRRRHPIRRRRRRPVTMSLLVSKKCQSFVSTILQHFTHQNRMIRCFGARTLC